jgi:LPXTG-motif cell wall-anchored protein
LEDVEDAQNDVTTAQTAGRTLGLDAANDLLQQAEDAYDAGDYEEASSLAGTARSAAASATAPETGGFEMMFVAAAALIVVAAAAFFFMRRKPSQSVVSAVSYDLEALFADRPHLRLDDKEVIRFLAENGGESFAAEIRERFNVPRTSLWRMIRRLQREEAVEVHNIGGQSLVRISPRYISGGEEG